MKWFDLQVNQKLLDQLKKSDIGFKFDPNISKHRLMLNLTHMPPMRKYSGMKIHHLLKYASVTAGVILVVSGSLVYAATNTKPGDKLFGLNKFGQQVILSLPLSAQTKASFQAKIVTSRLNDLDQLQ